jgi:hypothetical protein
MQNPATKPYVREPHDNVQTVKLNRTTRRERGENVQREQTKESTNNNQNEYITSWDNEYTMVINTH